LCPARRLKEILEQAVKVIVPAVGNDAAGGTDQMVHGYTSIQVYECGFKFREFFMGVGKAISSAWALVKPSARQ
jgi:hypothetical protein